MGLAGGVVTVSSKSLEDEVKVINMGERNEKDNVCGKVQSYKHRRAGNDTFIIDLTLGKWVFVGCVHRNGRGLAK